MQKHKNIKMIVAGFTTGPTLTPCLKTRSWASYELSHGPVISSAFGNKMRKTSTLKMAQSPICAVFLHHTPKAPKHGRQTNHRFCAPASENCPSQLYLEVLPRPSDCWPPSLCPNNEVKAKYVTRKATENEKPQNREKKHRKHLRPTEHVRTTATRKSTKPRRTIKQTTTTTTTRNKHKN